MPGLGARLSSARTQGRLMHRACRCKVCTIPHQSRMYMEPMEMQARKPVIDSTTLRYQLISERGLHRLMQTRDLWRSKPKRQEKVSSENSPVVALESMRRGDCRAYVMRIHNILTHMDNSLGVKFRGGGMSHRAIRNGKVSRGASLELSCNSDTMCWRQCRVPRAIHARASHAISCYSFVDKQTQSCAMWHMKQGHTSYTRCVEVFQ